MNYKLLGRSGLKVSELCLGAMGFGTEGGWGAEKDASFAIMDAFANAGGNFIDTANVYKLGTSEKIIGEYLSNHDRDYFLISKK
jgi:aryl-alcohol dehydrogenase-like predicted oxidoreductase